MRHTGCLVNAAMTFGLKTSVVNNRVFPPCQKRYWRISVLSERLDQQKAWWEKPELLGIQIGPTIFLSEVDENGITFRNFNVYECEEKPVWELTSIFHGRNGSSWKLGQIFRCFVSSWNCEWGKWTPIPAKKLTSTKLYFTSLKASAQRTARDGWEIQLA